MRCCYCFCILPCVYTSSSLFTIIPFFPYLLFLLPSLSFLTSLPPSLSLHPYLSSSILPSFSFFIYLSSSLSFLTFHLLSLSPFLSLPPFLPLFPYILTFPPSSPPSPSLPSSLITPTPSTGATGQEQVVSDPARVRILPREVPACDLGVSVGGAEELLSLQHTPRQRNSLGLPTPRGDSTTG